MWRLSSSSCTTSMYTYSPHSSHSLIYPLQQLNVAEISFPPPRPRPLLCCEQCWSSRISTLRLCGGTGKVITNYNRWYQKVRFLFLFTGIWCNPFVQCLNCSRFHWFNPSTPLSLIPFEIQLAFTLRESMDHNAAGTLALGISICTLCSMRKFNRNCEHEPKRCANCCRIIGGCRVHHIPPPRLLAFPPLSQPLFSSQPPLLLQPPPSVPQPPSSVSQPPPSVLQPPPSSQPPLSLQSVLPLSQSAVASGSQILPQNSLEPALPDAARGNPATLQTSNLRARSYARPLDENYANGWAMSRVDVAEGLHQVEVAQQLAKLASNTICIVLWYEVRVCIHFTQFMLILSCRKMHLRSF